MYPGSGSGRGMEACVRIEQENGMGTTNRRQHDVKQRRSAASIQAGQEMGTTEGKTTKNGIERFKARWEDTPHRCKVRGTPERGMGRKRGKRRRRDLCCLCLLHHNAALASGSCLLPSPQLCTEYRTSVRILSRIQPRHAVRETMRRPLLPHFYRSYRDNRYADRFTNRLKLILR